MFDSRILVLLSCSLAYTSLSTAYSLYIMLVLSFMLPVSFLVSLCTADSASSSLLNSRIDIDKRS